MLVQGVHRITGLCQFLRLAASATVLVLASSALAQWDAKNSGTKSSLRAIHNTGLGVAWASGTNGVVLRSEDDGYGGSNALFLRTPEAWIFADFGAGMPTTSLQCRVAPALPPSCTKLPTVVRIGI